MGFWPATAGRRQRDLRHSPSAGWALPAEKRNRRRWLRCLRKKPWAIYSQAPFAGPRELPDYPGRYTHRVAISNHRILSCQNGEVRYRDRDCRDGDRLKTDALPAEEFLHRFLQHVLPDPFPRIRHQSCLWPALALSERFSHNGGHTVGWPPQPAFFLEKVNYYGKQDRDGYLFVGGCTAPEKIADGVKVCVVDFAATVGKRDRFCRIAQRLSS